jgi:phosphotriesterase-related protein
MKPTKRRGKVQTVLGLVDAEVLGITSMHEHILFDMSIWCVKPAEASKRGLADQPVTWQNLYLIRGNRLINSDNMRQTNEQLAVKELLLYKRAGGNTIVELSENGLSRDPIGLARVSIATGLNIIMGCGYYVGASHPPDLAHKSEDKIAEEIVRDLTVGVGDTGIRSGIIGEIGCSIPLENGERKVLRACAAAQRQTGAPLNIHPSFSDDLVLENVKILKDAGADLSHTIISHVDQDDFGSTTCHRLADFGCYLEFDAFGHLGYPHLEQGNILNLTGDLERINRIMALIKDGYTNQILVGQDICFKDCLTLYGGFGYAHILNNVMPLMRAKGMSEEQINTIVVENPKRVLQFT